MAKGFLKVARQVSIFMTYLEREFHEWANFTNFLENYSRHSKIRAIRVKGF